MSIIQQLRDKAAVLLTTLIALSLIGFLVQDAFIGRSSGFFSGPPSNVGSINGKKVPLDVFVEKVRMAEEGYRSQGMQSSEMMTQNIVDGIWNGYIQEDLVKVQTEKLGINLTTKELGNLLFSEKAPQEFRQLFTDPNTGEFNVQGAKTWFSNIKKSKKSEEIKMVTEQLLNPLVIRLLTEKYTSIFAQGTYIPKWLIEKNNADNSSISSISFVSVPYATLADSLPAFKVTDEEINEYVKEHKDEFKQDEVRSVAYVVFDANPNSGDSSALFNQLSGLKQEFSTTQDARAFVTRNNTSLPYFDGYVLKSRLQMTSKDSIISMPTGSVIGPYLDAGNYVIARKLETRSLPDSIKCRHILIGTVDPRTGQARRSDTAARKTADSVLNVLKTGSDFGMLAATLSDDEGSKNNKGEYNFSSLDISNLAKEFGDFIFYKPTGSREVVKTNFGYHVIEVMNQKNFEESYKMAYVSKKIVASSETDNLASVNATQFSGNSRDIKSFEANVTKSNYTKLLGENIKKMDYTVSTLSSRALVRWIYENEVGSVSEPFDLKDKYVVVAITGSIPEGLQPASAARMMVEPILRNRKKAAEIRKKIGTPANLEAVANANKVSVMNADSIQFSSPFVADIGNEAKVIGAAFNKAHVNKVSNPISGNNGVYVISVKNISAVPTANTDIPVQKKALEAQLRQYASFATMEALKKAAKIEDRRSEAGY